MTTGSQYSADDPEDLFARGRAAMPGGVSHDSRFALPHPFYVARGAGSRKWDVEGNEYVDLGMGFASLLLGHAHPDVVAAITEQAALGTYHGACNALEVEWAGLVSGMVPSAERVRFTASGSEATQLALRLARAHTGKGRIMHLEGHYHGWHDGVMVGAMAPFDEPSTRGIAPGWEAANVVCPPDANRIEEALRAADDIAGVICEPSGANWGCVPLPPGFLAELRGLADRYGAVLIFDEVISGFRWAPGGIQELTGVMPDLTAMGKIVSGALPGGALGGREPIMRLLDPSVATDGEGPGVIHRGTFNGNPLVAAAAVATLRHVRTGKPQAHADQRAGDLRHGMQVIMREHQAAGVVYGESSTIHVYFGQTPDGRVDGMSAGQVRGMAKSLVAAYHGGLRKRGVDLLTYCGAVTSWAHTEEDVARVLDAFEGTIQELLADGQLPRA